MGLFLIACQENIPLVFDNAIEMLYSLWMVGADMIIIIAGRKSDEFYVGLLWTAEQKAL